MRRFEIPYLSQVILIVGIFVSVSLAVCVVTSQNNLLSSSSFQWTWMSSAVTPSSSSSPSSINGLRRKTKVFNVTYISPRVKKGEYVKLDELEEGLSRARALIKLAAAAAAQNQNQSSPYEDPEYVPHGDLYQNARVFHRSYLLMEKLFKIFVYEEGELPLFHNGPCKNIYSMEGFFINFMETDKRFRTRDPDSAHVYFLPFSVVMILQYLFHPIIRDKYVLGRTISDYVRIISERYPYWNRSLGADHVMLSCHDWGPRATWYVPELYFNSIRVLCNANTSERFNPRKDASFPEINHVTGEISGLIGGNLRFNSSILAFFAGNVHGRIRPALLQHWKEKDEDVRVYEKLPEGIDYKEMMQKSKYCICPSGWEVASPRIVEAIYAECVPVLISQHYILPFSDVINWDSFSIQITPSLWQQALVLTELC
ncbi:Xylogalacturonan beta-1,3-xylosyltransferase [Thalictrum thalictroides]|uniref:Xylogalacturonan beta-1,3-xylosyltransferase n=1 Tax=Thalictrum thalictroides TaxID=46969 RepID=A0A7J6WGA7_THATH|nr:Xylogalacturonan beta-1,3-xylosyltransferase [Thalictrum thalictroides]